MATPDIIVQVKGGKTSVITTPTGSATRLVQLADVNIAGLTDGQVLTYVAANGRYEFAVTTDNYARPHSNGAFDQANTANVTAHAAYNQANVATPNVGLITIMTPSVLANSSQYVRTDATNVSISTYSTLYAVIGRSYGNGDGNTTFSLPSIPPLLTSWIQGTDMTKPNQQPGALTLSDGRVIVIGGLNGSSGDVFANAQFGNVAGTTIVWNAGTPLPASRYQLAAVQLPDSRILVIGGRDGGGGLLSSTYFGNISGTTITWTAGTSLPMGITLHTATALQDGRILVTGGLPDGGIVTSNTFLGNITGTTITWTPSTSLPEVKQKHTSTLLIDGRVLISGGADGSGTLLQTTYFGEITGNSILWYAGSQLPVALASHTVTLLQHASLLLIGGAGALWNNVYVGTLYGKAISWTSVSTLPELKQQHIAVKLLDDRIITLGGITLPSSATSNATYFGTLIPFGIKFS